MGTVIFRADYAKFLIMCRPEHWQSYYHRLNEESHQIKAAGEWLKSHKVNRLWFNAEQGMETWSIDIWGEWAVIVERLPIEWLGWLKRFDVRATVWDATKDTVLDVGQHLQKNITSHNINVFSTKPASKRLGRDRGGVGFAIGSHKSDLRITCYKRTNEPVAQEFQCSGAMLRRHIEEVFLIYSSTKGTASAWYSLRYRIEEEGQKRLQRVLENAGIGTYWPLVGAAELPHLDNIQSTFIPTLGEQPPEPEDDQGIGSDFMPS